MARIDKLSKLFAVFDQFYHSIALLDDITAKRLIENWNNVRYQYEESSDIPRSVLAAGLEQGLRETPMLLRAMPTEVRKLAMQSLAAATFAHHPDFISKDAERIAKIKVRGAIRGESEFYLVRDHIDFLEGELSNESDLRLLRKLVDKFESSGK